MPEAERRLVIFVHSECRYCAAEMPFYRELYGAQSAGRTFRLHFVGLESESVLRAYLAKNGLAGAAVMSVPPVPGVRGTPTILLIDANGLVSGSWQGVLSPTQKKQLLRLL